MSAEVEKCAFKTVGLLYKKRDGSLGTHLWDTLQYVVVFLLKAWGQERPGDLNIFSYYRESKRWKAQEDVSENRPFDSECGLAAGGGVNRDIPVSHCSDAEMYWYLLILIRAEKQKQKSCMWLWSAVIHLEPKPVWCGNYDGRCLCNPKSLNLYLNYLLSC